MGYNIIVGEAVTMWPTEKEIKEYGDDTPRVVVDGVSLNFAPSFPGDDMTGHSNARYPSYSAWAGWCDRVGLTDLFFNEETGLMRKHPGCVVFSSKHLEAVRDALTEHQSGFGMELVEGRCPCNHCNGGFCKKDAKHQEKFIQPQSYDRARLVWLEWWMTWALKNCEHPAIYNS